MLIQQKQGGHKGAFYLEENNITLAEMTYSMTGTVRGKNVVYQLVHTAVEYARTNHIKILPLCTFAKSVFDKKGAEFADVLRGN